MVVASMNRVIKDPIAEAEKARKKKAKHAPPPKTLAAFFTGSAMSFFGVNAQLSAFCFARANNACWPEALTGQPVDRARRPAPAAAHAAAGRRPRAADRDNSTRPGRRRPPQRAHSPPCSGRLAVAGRALAAARRLGRAFLGGCHSRAGIIVGFIVG